MSNLTLILATHREASVRNGTEAVRLATRACVLTGCKEAQVVGTLAAAYAEAGRFANAVATAEQTRELALAADKPGTGRQGTRTLKAASGWGAAPRTLKKPPPALAWGGQNPMLLTNRC